MTSGYKNCSFDEGAERGGGGRGEGEGEGRRKRRGGIGEGMSDSEARRNSTHIHDVYQPKTWSQD